MGNAEQGAAPAAPNNPVDDALDRLPRMVGLIRDAIGYALAEKNIPREPQWILLVPQHLDDIDSDIATVRDALQQARDELATIKADTADWYATNWYAKNPRAEAAEAEVQRLTDLVRVYAEYEGWGLEAVDDGTDEFEAQWGKPALQLARALLADTPKPDCKHGIIEINHATGVATCPKCGETL